MGPTTRVEDWQVLLQRLSQVEAHCRWWKRAAVVVLTAAGVSLLMAAQPTAGGKVVDANRIVLRDALGRARAELKVAHGEPSLDLFDARGQRRSRLGVGQDGSSLLSLHDPTGTRRATLAVGKDGRPRLDFFDEDGTPRPPTGTAPTPIRPSAAAVEPAQATRGLYARLCARCHLADGRGARGKGKAAIPDFTDPAWQRSRSDAQLTASILDGMGTRMPAFSDRLDNAQTRDMVLLVRSFGPALSRGGDPADTSFQRRWRQLEQEWQELQRQVDELRKR